jgi:hypothetical protein
MVPKKKMKTIPFFIFTFNNFLKSKNPEIHTGGGLHEPRRSFGNNGKATRMRERLQFSLFLRGGEGLTKTKKEIYILYSSVVLGKSGNEIIPSRLGFYPLIEALD